MTNLRSWCALLLCAFTFPLAAQFQTPNLDGVVSGGEYAHTSGNWSMTWNDTYIYIANNGHSPSTTSYVIYLDVDPSAVPGAGIGSNGSRIGYTDFGMTPSLPF